MQVNAVVVCHAGEAVYFINDDKNIDPWSGMVNWLDDAYISTNWYLKAVC